MSMEPDRFRFEIASGLYEGVVETLPEGRYRIGSDLEADIVLVEDGVAPHHVTVGVSGAFARIEALADGVVAEAIGVVPAGRAADVPLPTTITIGAIRIALAREPRAGAAAAVSRPRPAALPSRNALRAVLMLPALAVLMLAVFPNPVADALIRVDPKAEGLAAAAPPEAPESGAAASPRSSRTVPAITGSTAATAVHAARSDVPAQRPSQLAFAARRPLSQPAVREAADALRAEVERAGLLSVVVEPGPGVVMAAGTVEPGATARWQSVQQWFDERFAGEITLVNGVDVKAEKMPGSLGIEAVWRGQPSHLVIRGQKYLEGAVLDGGWTIHRIEAERVILQRDGRLVAVRY